MSIPQRSPHRLSRLQQQGFSGFEEPVGTKYQENKKCPSNWKELVEKAAGSTKMERWEMSREII
ncbi:hypothetical protein HNQ34_003077 [Anoxybacillus tepidamans]|uniref:Uncharacterized protein n=1 Tax=Anoxybacteroides tepidamans TaxID=265948 RepID=A0A7W8ISK1_9BACL|nr:hypothetical protein [Anoxybacillus tepidamans]